MSYKITITQIATIESVAGKEWVQIGTKEVPREDRYFQQDKDEPKTRLEPVYGYSPEISKRKIMTEEVFTQTVPDLDLAAVIKAINKI